MCRDIFKIEEKDHVYSMKFDMMMEWYDYRLEYYNLKGIYLFLFLSLIFLPFFSYLLLHLKIIILVMV